MTSACQTAAPTEADAGPADGNFSNSQKPNAAELFVTTELHAEGPCEVLHLTDDGRSLLSVGSDGKFTGVDILAGSDGEAASRPWNTRPFGPSSLLTAAAVNKDRTCLAMGQESEIGFAAWVIAMDEKTGRLATGNPPKVLARFTLAVRDLKWHPALPLLGIAADDGKLSVVWHSADFQGPKRRDFPTERCGGGGVRCLAFDPTGQWIAAAFSSGNFVVYSLEGLTEVFSCIAWPKSVMGRERLSISWQPGGGAIALPGETSLRLLLRKDIVEGRVVSSGRSTQTPFVNFDGGHRHGTNLASWSVGGQFLVSASCDSVALWSAPLNLTPESLKSAKPLRVWNLSTQPASLIWGEDAIIVVGTQTGAYARLQVPSETELAEQQLADAVPAGDAQTQTQKQDSLPEDTAEDCKDDAQNEQDCSQPKKPVEFIRQGRIQPGATGVGGLSGRPRRRYLCWNDYGSLKLHPPGQRKSAGAGLVEVEYSRERGRSAVREFKAPIGLEFGVVGPGMFALGSNGSSKNGNLKPRINVHLATPWEKASFEHTLPTGERIEALAIGRTFVATFSSPLRLLRISSLAGFPIGTIAMSGNVVCLVGFEDLLMSITQAPRSDISTQCRNPALDFTLHSVASKVRIASGSLPLSASSVLRWAGFSTEGMPLALDSEGILRALALGGSGAPSLVPSAGEWIPVAELEGKGKLLWTVRAEGGALLCVEVAADGEEPSLGHRLKLREVKFQLPLGDTAFAAWDQVKGVLRSRLLSAHASYAVDAKLLPELRRKAIGDLASQRRARGTEGRQTVKLFDSLAKMKELEQALDVAKVYLSSSGMSIENDIEMLSEAKRLAAAMGREPLAEKVSEQAASLDRSRRGSVEESSEDESGEEDSGEDAQKRAGPVLTEAPPVQRMRVC